ncbi:hypothetical protein SAMN05216368_101301 [Cryobacterium flavum]|uniref:DUF4352 domain-containing protein n=1 Tax=Cryobacterium flavum TaxID=1424659 RepID=A0A4R8V705_9MICO|nr:MULTISPECIES: hypothetical protein [Cryobacterium]TFB77711.1 hypothetical protein E3O21_08560 [Cryobacterium flavum]SDM55571.1 hypothetical protein SAMN05216368_101301 [Cryobacterium flavum]
MTPTNATLRLVRLDDGAKHPETTRQTQPRRALSPRRRKILIPLAVVWLVMAALACALLLTGTKPSTAFGDTTAVPGGLARISAVIPLESDGWVPPGSADRLDSAVQPGAHRVRILLELTAADAAGLSFDAADYSLSGVGSHATALWVDLSQREAAAGTSVLATLVFEIPNQAIALVLDGPQGARLSLGTGHHTAP